MPSKFLITVGTMLALLSVNSCFVLYKQMVQSKCFQAFFRFCLIPVLNNTVNLPNLDAFSRIDKLTTGDYEMLVIAEF